MHVMRRLLALLAAIAVFLPTLSGCKLGGGFYLTVYNWADYIDESVLDEFTEFYKKDHPNFRGVTYETCDTPETMYTKFAKSGEPWDVACNSDYLEGKLLRRGDIQPFPVEQMPNYNEYISEYMKEQYLTIQNEAIVKSAETGEKYDAPGVEFNADGTIKGVYGIGYMWGTMGIVYNVADAERAGGAEKLFRNWNLMWNSSFDHRVYMKNSVRESYIVGLLQAYTPELEAQLKVRSDRLAAIADDDTLSEDGKAEARGEADEAYRSFLSKVLGTVDETSVGRAQAALIDQQDEVNVKYDVDYDKIAMATNKASLDYCWAGDGYKALMMGAEENPKVVLSYGVPDTGTNLFFDGWFLNSKLEKDSPVYRAAVAFVDFLCAPDQAKRNMTEIGYVSATGGLEMLEWGAENWRLASEGETGTDGKKHGKIIFDEALKAKGDGIDVEYFFGSEVIEAYRAAHNGEDPKINPIQYPDAGEMYKFAVVKTYENKETDRLLEMWAQVKTGDFPTLQIVLFSCIAAIMIGLAVFKLVQKAKAKKSAVKTVKTKRNYDRIR